MEVCRVDCRRGVENCDGRVGNVAEDQTVIQSVTVIVRIRRGGKA